MAMIRGKAAAGCPRGLRGSRGRLAALVLFVLHLLGGAAAPAVAAGLKMAVADNPYAVPVLIAEREGFFAAEGLALEIVRYPLGKICLDRLLAGEVQFATTAEAPIMMAGFNRRDFGILATMTMSSRETQIVVRSDRGIQEPADLRGKRFGILEGTSAHYFGDTFLLFYGMGQGAVTSVALDPSDPAGAIARGEVDAAALLGIQARKALKLLGPNGRLLPSPPIFSVSFNIVAAPGVSDDDAVKLLRAVRRAMDLIQGDPARARTIAAAALKVDAAALADSWGDLEFRLHLAQPLITTLEAEARWAIRRHLVQAQTVPDYLDLVRPEPLRRLDARVVKIVK